MATITIIDPVTRVEGHLKVSVSIDAVRGEQKVVDAHVAGTLFRGFEKLLVGRDPWDAQHITQRICGVCPIPHSMAAVIANEAANNATIPMNALLMRNLVLGANFVESHILHFYLLSALDYIDGPAMQPWLPTWSLDRRFSAAEAGSLLGHYLKAIEMKRKGQECGALFGGRMPHAPAYIPGGFTNVPTETQITLALGYLAELKAFITDAYIPDVELLSSVYSDYAEIGKGYGSLMSFGVFDEDTAGKTKLLKPGFVAKGAGRNGDKDDDKEDDHRDEEDRKRRSKHDDDRPGSPKKLDVASITEQVKYSWYDRADSNLPPRDGKTDPVYPKGSAYSWLKSPRYNGQPMEVGPLARMWMNGDYRKGVSVADRHLARAYEALKIAQAMERWVANLVVGGPVHVSPGRAVSAQGYGLTEAPRGAIGHWLKIDNGMIGAYQVITPTCWNCSPRDDKKQLGPMEKALIGTPVQDPDRPVEVLRVVHSFDPCLDCAVHAVRAK